MTKTTTKLIRALLVALFLILVCIIIRPAGLAANDGLSYFGGYLNTVVPYSLAYLIIAYTDWAIAQDIKTKAQINKVLSTSLKIISILIIGLVLTPHQLINPIHTAFGSALFSFQLILSFWLMYKLNFDWLLALLVVFMLLSGITAFYYLPKNNGLLLQTQLVFQISFSGFLIRLQKINN